MNYGVFSGFGSKQRAAIDSAGPGMELSNMELPRYLQAWSSVRASINRFLITKVLIRESLAGFQRMLTMANSVCRVSIVISLFLTTQQVFLTQPVYCTDRNISERHAIRSTNWEKNATDFFSSWSQRKLIGLLANSGNARVITVDKNKVLGDFTTVQDAINAVPTNNKNPVTINVKAGTYREKVTIPKEKPFITLTGSGAKNTVITWNADTKSSGGTYNSGTVTVLASDFKARDITIENTYGPGDEISDDQAVALRVSGNRSAFYNCRFLGYQDTLLDESGKHYFQNCYIEGSADFICGNGKSLYQNCQLHAIPVLHSNAVHPGVYTAQKRSSPSEDIVFVFLNCKLTGRGQMYLGRPWGAYSTVVFVNSVMDNIILPEGWLDWPGNPERRNTAKYSEYQCSGPGAGQTGRVSWVSKVTDRSQIASYLSLGYINGNTWVN